MKKYLFFSLSFVVLFSGCFGTQYRVTFLNGQNQQQYYTDKIFCQQLATYNVTGYQANQYYASGGTSQQINDELFFDCLRAKGYGIEFQ